jgi:hypothetical protein
MKELEDNDKRRMERYATEKEYLFDIFSAKDDIERLKDCDKDFRCLLGEKEQRVSALVLSVSTARKTKTTGSTYYQVSLMDKNGNTVSRRFKEPPQNMVGTFLLQPENQKFFYCKELGALKPKPPTTTISFSDAMAKIVDGSLSPDQLNGTGNTTIGNKNIGVISYEGMIKKETDPPPTTRNEITEKNDEKEQEDTCMELSS